MSYRARWQETYAALLAACADAAFRDLSASGSRCVYVTITPAGGRAWGTLHLEGAETPSSGRRIACRLDASQTRDGMIATLRAACGRLPLIGEEPCDRVFAGPVEPCRLHLDHPGPCRRPDWTPARSALETVPPCRPRSSEDRADNGPPVYCLRCRYHHGPGVDGCPSGSGRDLDPAPAGQPSREA